MESNAELEAVRIALNGTRAQRLAIASRAMRALHADPNDTHQVFLLGIALNGPFMKNLLGRMANDDEGSRLLLEQPAIDTEHVDFEQLAALPASTLGGAYARYLESENLDPDLFKAPPGLPAIPAYLAQRMRQTHDIWHVLTGYRTDIVGEVALQAFSYAQLRMPSSVVLTLIGTFKLVGQTPQIISAAWDGFQRGSEASFLASVRFEDLWQEDLEALRTRLKIRPARVDVPEVRAPVAA